MLLLFGYRIQIYRIFTVLFLSAFNGIYQENWLQRIYCGHSFKIPNRNIIDNNFPTKMLKTLIEVCLYFVILVDKLQKWQLLLLLFFEKQHTFHIHVWRIIMQSRKINKYPPVFSFNPKLILYPFCNLKYMLNSNWIKCSFFLTRSRSIFLIKCR